MTKPTKWVYAQWRLRLSWATSQFCCPHEETLGGCPGWSESSLGAHSFYWFCHVVAHIVQATVMEYNKIFEKETINFYLKPKFMETFDCLIFCVVIDKKTFNHVFAFIVYSAAIHTDWTIHGIQCSYLMCHSYWLISSRYTMQLSYVSFILIDLFMIYNAAIVCVIHTYWSIHDIQCSYLMCHSYWLIYSWYTMQLSYVPFILINLFMQLSYVPFILIDLFMVYSATILCAFILIDLFSPEISFLVLIWFLSRLHLWTCHASLIALFCACSLKIEADIDWTCILHSI